MHGSGNLAVQATWHDCIQYVALHPTVKPAAVANSFLHTCACLPCSCAGVETAVFRDVIFKATDSFPNHSIDLATLLRPPHVAGSTTAVNLTNVVLLHTISASQAAVAVATLRGVVSDPIVQRAIADWTLQLYTVSLGGPSLGSTSNMAAGQEVPL